MRFAHPFAKSASTTRRFGAKKVNSSKLKSRYIIGKAAPLNLPSALSRHPKHRFSQRFGRYGQKTNNDAKQDARQNSISDISQTIHPISKCKMSYGIRGT